MQANTSSKDDIDLLSLNQLAVLQGFTGTITLNSSLKVVSKTTIAGGTFDGTNDLELATDTNAAGSVTLADTVFKNHAVKVFKGLASVLQITGAVTFDNAFFFNYATGTWTAGDIALVNNAFFTNGGSFDIQTAASITSADATGVMWNNANATLKKTAGLKTEIQVDFFNAGNFSVDTAEVAFQAKAIQRLDPAFINTPPSPMTTVKANALITFDNSFKVQAGLVQGEGFIGGDLVNSGGIVAPGINGAPGVLSITGKYTQESGGTLKIFANNPVGGPAVSLLQVGDIASLDGTLQVVRDDAFTPQLFNSFQFLSYAGLDATHGDFSTFNFGTNNSWSSNGIDSLFFSPLESATEYRLRVNLQA